MATLSMHNIRPHVSSFLDRNGFVEKDEWIFYNGLCQIEIMPTSYNIEFGEDFGSKYYTTNHHLPNLLGVLLWYKLIDRNTWVL